MAEHGHRLKNPVSIPLQKPNEHEEENTGKKFDQGKLDFSLLPWESLEEVVKVLEFGAKKYSVDNWKKVTPTERYDAAALRHRIAYQKGEKNDPETGLSHLAHEACCVLFKIWFDLQEEKVETSTENIDILHKNLEYINPRKEMYLSKKEEN